MHSVFYLFRVRQPNGEWRVTGDWMTLDEVRTLYGSGNYEKVDGTQQIVTDRSGRSRTQRNLH